MQTLLLKYMNTVTIYNIQKRSVDIIVSLMVLMWGCLIFVFYAVKNKMILKKDIFISKKINQTKVYYFNTANLVLKNIPLFYSILKADMTLVGLAFNSQSFKQNESARVGLCSLWTVRKNSKMPNLCISECNEEYMKNKSFLYDLKLLIKSLITLLYYQNTNRCDSKVNLLDIEFDNLTSKDILREIQQTIDKKTKKSIFFVNADCLNKSIDDYAYKYTLKKADLILPDGSGINMACNILQSPLRENLNGTDLFPHICSLAQNKSYRIYLLGAQEGVAKMMKNRLNKEYPLLQVVGTHHGYTDNAHMDTLIENINQSKPDILFVALGAPAQEIFIEQYKHQIDARLFLGVGGLFDFYSQRIKRAPLFIREIGFEWVYRMVQEPKRMWKRYILGNPKFLYRVYRYKKNMKKDLLIEQYLSTYDTASIHPEVQNRWWAFSLLCSSFFKRAVDIFVSAVMLILLFPLFCVVALCIRTESKGNVLFSQNRVGIKGRLFKMYKFRSMRKDASSLQNELANQNESKDGVIFKMKDDPRITKVGKFIRKTSIDELPQLFNVLIGEMSLVGPRPPVPDEVALYSIEERKRLDVKPGITCIWQVSGRSEIPFKQQVLMDKKYIKEHSFMYDIVLLLKTIPAVLSSKGSY